MNDTSSRSLRILVVEDELLIATSLELSLEGHGHRVLGPVSIVAAAQRILQTEQPDLALIDYRLADPTAGSAPSGGNGPEGNNRASRTRPAAQSGHSFPRGHESVCGRHFAALSRRVALVQTVRFA